MRGGIDPGDRLFLPWLVGVVHVREDFGSGDGTLTSPAGAGSTNPRLRFSHRAGRYRPRGPPFASPVRWSFRCMGGFLIWG